jgi:RimJ/RimL family protein N-acetyltransferase
VRNRRPEPHQPTPSELFRAPIITDRLIIREATRADARALENTMDAAELAEGARTTDGARRFDSGLGEVPVWSAARVVCEKGSVRVVGGVVLTTVGSMPGDARRIGWWLVPGAEEYGTELINAVSDRVRAMGADSIVMHVRADDEAALGVAEEAGFVRGDSVRHTTSAGDEIDFVEYVRTTG